MGIMVSNVGNYQKAINGPFRSMFCILPRLNMCTSLLSSQTVILPHCFYPCLLHTLHFACQLQCSSSFEVMYLLNLSPYLVMLGLDSDQSVSCLYMSTFYSSFSAGLYKLQPFPNCLLFVPGNVTVFAPGHVYCFCRRECIGA